MLTEVDQSLLIGAIFVGLVALILDNRRGILWIAVAALSYINATIAWRLELPCAEAITGMGDAAVCLAVYFWGRYRWELLIWRLFQISVAISMLFLAGNMGVFLSIPHLVYSILTEAINWLLLLLILGISVMQWVGAANVSALRPWNRIRDLALVIRAKRTRDPFYKVK